MISGSLAFVCFNEFLRDFKPISCKKHILFAIFAQKQKKNTTPTYGGNMQIKGDALLNKLILLFVFDKMECPLTENTIIDMCCSSNNWISYMDCKPIINQLLEHGFIYRVSQGGEPLYSITPDGRVCLADFFVQIPTSMREDISHFVKVNRTKYRKKQEFTADYYMNKDGTYTVNLKIVEPAHPLFELKMVVPNRLTAKNIYKKWEEKGGDVYGLVYDNLVD